ERSRPFQIRRQAPESQSGSHQCAGGQQCRGCQRDAPVLAPAAFHSRPSPEPDSHHHNIHHFISFWAKLYTSHEVTMIHRLKAAVFGTGFVGRVHVEGIRRLGYVQVYAIAASQKEKAARLGEELHVEKTAGDYRQILEDPEVDVVHVCTPNALHFPMAKDALEAGKHVVCEKPLTTSAELGSELARLASEKKLANCTFHNLRYYPMVQHMRRMR